MSLEGSVAIVTGGTKRVAIMVEGLALQLLAETGRCRQVVERAPRPPKWLSAAHDFVIANFKNDLRLSDIAQAAGVHPVHLNKSFKEYFGATIGEHIRRLRIQFASQLLSDTDLPLSSIAADAGFCDQSHFTHVFRQRMRATPGSYRRSVRAAHSTDQG